MSNLYTNPMQAGRDAFKNGKSIMDNPISKRTHANSALLWDMGYLAESTSEAKSTNLYDKVETYNFTCEAGPLELCTDWQALRAENAAQALLIASLKDERDMWQELHSKTHDQLSDTQRQNAELVEYAKGLREALVSVNPDYPEHSFNIAEEALAKPMPKAMEEHD